MLNFPDSIELPERWIKPSGKPGGLAVILDYPSPMNWNNRSFFWGQERQLFTNTLMACIPEGEILDMRFYYAIPFPPSNKKPSQDEIVWASKLLRHQLSEDKPTKVLLMGPASTASFWEQKQSNIVHTRGRLRVKTLENGHRMNVMSTVPIFYVDRDPDFFRDFSYDIHKLLNQKEEVPFPEIERYIVRSPRDLKDGLDFLRQASAVSCDFETTGLNPRTDRVEAVGISALSADRLSSLSVILPKDRIYDVEYADLMLDFLTGKTYSGTVVFHNAKFDLKFLEVWSNGMLRVDDILTMNVRDTMLMNYLLDERPLNHDARPHGLKAISRVRYDAEDFKFDFDAFWSGGKTDDDYDELYSYLSIDLHYTIRLYFDLLDEINEESPRLLDVLNKLLMPGTTALAQIEQYGIKVDVPYLRTLGGEVQNVLDGLMTEIRAILREHSILVQRAAVDTSALATLNDPILAWINTFNCNSPKQVSSAVYDHLNAATVNGRSTDKDTLLQLGHLYRGQPLGTFCEKVTTYRTQSKALSTYINGLINLADENGRVHGEFNLPGTGTGRLSSSNPNLQNQPTLMGPMIRKAFVAPEGFDFAEVDYSQLELRVVAHLSQDQSMIQAYRDNRDIHREVASAAFGVPYDQVDDDQRYAAKYLDFGIIYGRTAQAVSDAPELVDYDWTVEEAQQFIDNFLDQFPGLKEWIDGQHKFVVENQYVESLTGRRRRWPLLTPSLRNSIERQAVNTPIQGLASDFTLTALIELHTIFAHKGYKSRAVSTVHDSILFEIHKDETDVVCELIQRVMTTHLPVENCVVPIRVDVEIGKNWGELENWEQPEFSYWYHPESESWTRAVAGREDDLLVAQCVGPFTAEEKAEQQGGSLS